MEAYYPQAFASALVNETRRRLFEESVPRIKTCLDLLTEAQIWQRPHPEMASIGNLVLHLCGNARQWVVSGLHHQPDTRLRQEEFNTTGPLPTPALLQRLEQLQQELEEALDQVAPEALLETHPVQVFEESGLSILVHVVEHFSYHVGQISWYTKMLTHQDLGYYKGLNL